MALPRCPHCQHEIVLRQLPHEGLWRSDRRCPDCGKRFTVDPATKRRQAAFIVVALITLVLTVASSLGHTALWIPALIGNLALVALIIWGNHQLHLVPVESKGQAPKGESPR